MNIVHATGIEGARNAEGVVVVIDVLRSFTVSAYALAGGARECLLVRTVAEARALAANTPGSVICAEEEALPVEGIPISNSPTKITETDLRGRALIQRSTAGTQVAAAVPEGRVMFAASLVVARATVQACLLRGAQAEPQAQPQGRSHGQARNPSARTRTLTLIASADHPEDHACARYMEAIARGENPDLDALLAPLRAGERYARARSGAWPGFPSRDLDLSLVADRFDFAMPVTRAGDHLRVTLLRPS